MPRVPLRRAPHLQARQAAHLLQQRLPPARLPTPARERAANHRDATNAVRVGVHTHGDGPPPRIAPSDRLHGEPVRRPSQARHGVWCTCPPDAIHQVTPLRLPAGQLRFVPILHPARAPARRDCAADCTRRLGHRQPATAHPRSRLATILRRMTATDAATEFRFRSTPAGASRRTPSGLPSNHSTRTPLRRIPSAAPKSRSR